MNRLIVGYGTHAPPRTPFPLRFCVFSFADPPHPLSDSPSPRARPAAVDVDHDSSTLDRLGHDAHPSTDPCRSNRSRHGSVALGPRLPAQSPRMPRPRRLQICLGRGRRRRHGLVAVVEEEQVSFPSTTNQLSAWDLGRQEGARSYFPRRRHLHQCCRLRLIVLLHPHHQVVVTGSFSTPHDHRALAALCITELHPFASPR